MAEGKYLLDGERVADLRCEKGWTQEQLAFEARLSPRTIQQVEANEDTFRHSTVEQIADALGVDTEQLIWSHLLSWQQVPTLNDPQREAKLTRAIRHDMEGKHYAAAVSCQEILEDMSFDSAPEAYAAVLIKRVTFLDHDKQHSIALQELDGFLQRVGDLGLASREAAWALYHKSICLRRMGEFEKARRLLDALRKSGRHEYTTSSLHQMAVVDLEEAKQRARLSSVEDVFVQRRLRAAERQFEECLLEWEALDNRLNSAKSISNTSIPIGSTHRIGFTLRRLGELYGLIGRHRDAIHCYYRAMATFSWHHCHRYVTETHQEMERLLRTI